MRSAESADERRLLRENLHSQALGLISELKCDIDRPTRSLTPAITALLDAMTRLVQAGAHQAWTPIEKDEFADAAITERILAALPKR